MHHLACQPERRTTTLSFKILCNVCNEGPVGISNMVVYPGSVLVVRETRWLVNPPSLTELAPSGISAPDLSTCSQTLQRVSAVVSSLLDCSMIISISPLPQNHKTTPISCVVCISPSAAAGHGTGAVSGADLSDPVTPAAPDTGSLCTHRPWELDAPALPAQL